MHELLVMHLPRLHAYIRLRMGSELRARESTSDLVQSACREVLKQAHRFQYPGEEGFRHWLFATALRKVKNKLAYYRAAKRDAANEDVARASSDEALAEYYETLSSPSGHLLRKERIELLEACIQDLSEDHREVILLARVIGLPHKEVASTMGRTEGATRSLLRRALLELSTAMLRRDPRDSSGSARGADEEPRTD